ncbi:GTPase-like protein [Fragilaria crotonensis]|nr:GTPase-like protein [Fragilaria crotonensis]
MIATPISCWRNNAHGLRLDRQLQVTLLMLLFVVRWFNTDTTCVFCAAYVPNSAYLSHQHSSLAPSSSTRRNHELGIGIRVAVSRKRQRNRRATDRQQCVRLSCQASDHIVTNEEDGTQAKILESMGWDAHFQNQISVDGDDNDQFDANSIPVRVTEVRSNGLRVVGPGLTEQILIPPSSGRKRNDVVVGDWILLRSTTEADHDESDNDDNIHNHQPLIIHRLLKRKSLLQRRAPGPSRKTQLIAANLDTVFLVSSFNQDFNVARLERYIAMALEADVAPVIVLTKRDVYDGTTVTTDDDDDVDDDDDDVANEDVMAMLDSYVSDAQEIADSVPVVTLDARGDEPLSKLAKWCRPGQTVAFLGSSGVGKSTLVNSLCGEKVAATAAIHEDSGQGRHTTTRRQLFFLSNGCSVIDTPGLRELQLLDVSRGLAEVFSDLVELSTQCRFNDCQHDGEPGCAVEAAVEQGTVDGDRVARWQKLVAEDLINSKTMIESKAKVLQKQMRQKQAKKNKRNK